MITFNDLLAKHGHRLMHHGIKGQKWGVRRRNPGAATSVVLKETPGRRLGAKGGANHPASEDAKRAATFKQTAKKSSVDSLDNKQLQELVTRMNLERQFSTLSKGNESAGLKFAKSLITNTGKQQISRIANDAAAQQIGAALKKPV